MSKLTSLAEILKLRGYLQRITQLSYSYSQVNKTVPRTEELSEKDLEELKKTYLGFMSEAQLALSEFEHEYVRPKNDSSD